MTKWWMVGSLVVSSAALAGPPAHELPSEAEWEELLKGHVVTRGAPELEPPGAYGWVEVEADEARVWEVLLDPAVAIGGSGAVKACDVYLDEATPTGRKLGLHYQLRVAWTDVSYHVLRDLRPADDTMTWTLDQARPNDLVSSNGHYVLTKARTPGHLLLVYRSQADSGRSIPTWIQQALSKQALKGYLTHVRDVAEAP